MPSKLLLQSDQSRLADLPTYYDIVRDRDHIRECLESAVYADILLPCLADITAAAVSSHGDYGIVGLWLTTDQYPIRDDAIYIQIDVRA